MIPGLADTFSAILDGFCWTIADAGHAVGTGLAPDGVAALQSDVVHRAALGALAAADA